MDTIFVKPIETKKPKAFSIKVELRPLRSKHTKCKQKHTQFSHLCMHLHQIALLDVNVFFHLLTYSRGAR